jgi:hypothetical protein
LQGRQGEDLQSISWSPNGRFIVGGVADGILTIWDVNTTRALAYLHIFKDASVTVTPEGFFSGTGLFLPRVHFIKEMDVFDSNHFYNAFNRPDLVERKLQGEDISQATRNLRLIEGLKIP